MGKQVSPFFPVCPSCERDIPNPNEGGFTLKNCCREIIHTTCLASYDTCHICQHENNALAKYSSIGFSVDISTQSILRERKYIHWQPGCIYQFSAGEPCYPNSCWTYDQSHPHWHIYPHLFKKSWQIHIFFPPKILSSGLSQICLNPMRRPARLCVAQIINGICNVCCLLYVSPPFRKLF